MNPITARLNFTNYYLGGQAKSFLEEAQKAFAKTFSNTEPASTIKNSLLIWNT